MNIKYLIISAGLFIILLFVKSDRKGGSSIETDCLVHKSDTIIEKFGEYDLRDRMDHYNVPGISIAIVKDEKIIWAEGFGIADKNSNLAVSENTLFQAASISKVITALGALKLVEKGLIDLDIDINQYLEEYKVPENNFTINSKVTLRTLLSHTAGINVNGFSGYRKNDTIPSTKDILMGSGNSDKVTILSIPGTEWRYSGGGYILIQKIIEEVSKQSFEEFMKQEVLDKLNMTNSTFIQGDKSVNHNSRSTGYDGNGEPVYGNWNIYPEKAAAGLWTTPSDLAKYCIAIEQIYSGKDKNGILSQKMIKTMLQKTYPFEPSTPNFNISDEYERYYGLGVEIAMSKNVLRFQHSGSNNGFKSNLTAFANEGKAIIIMTNGDQGFNLVIETEKILSENFKLGIYD